MDIHDGARVEKLMVKKGISRTKLADAIGIGRTTLNSWFQKASWGTHELTTASKILEADLLKPYTDHLRTQHGVLLFNQGKSSKMYSIEPLEELDQKTLLRLFNPLEP